MSYEKLYLYENGNKLISIKLIPGGLESGDLLEYMKKLKEIYGAGTEVRATKKY